MHNNLKKAMIEQSAQQPQPERIESGDRDGSIEQTAQ